MSSKGNQQTSEVEIRISASPEYLSVARSAVRKVVELVGLAEHQADGVILALDEALTNVIRHSYGGPCNEQILVTMRRRHADKKGADSLEFIVRDFGKQVDPETIKGRDLDEVRPGGLGVHIIRSVMDEVEYSCPLDGGMKLRMVKYVDCPDTSDEASSVNRTYI